MIMATTTPTIRNTMAMAAVVWSVCLFFVSISSRVEAKRLLPTLSDPDVQPKFEYLLPNLLLDDKFHTQENEADNDNSNHRSIQITARWGIHHTGLVQLLDDDGGSLEQVPTPFFGYASGDDEDIGLPTWPGPTIQAETNQTLHVHWNNQLPNFHVLTNSVNQSVVDTSLHWCYSIEEYQHYTIQENGVPIVPHLHGGHSDAAADGNPEYFFSPNFEIKGPRWVSEMYSHDNSQPATSLWYHDHALGITRLNVYAGLSGFYMIRDDIDSGDLDNTMGLPAGPYEVPLMVQDRMFKQNGELFYPAYPGDPTYDSYIKVMNAHPPSEQNDSIPTILSEFYGDHFVVNGKIWPKLEVEPRHYRLRLLNACDSRFLVVQFRPTTLLNDTFVESTVRNNPMTFMIVGADQGLSRRFRTKTTLLIPPAGRFDIVVDFSKHVGERILLTNTGGDIPFGGSLPGPKKFDHMDKILAFDVVKPKDDTIPDRFRSSAKHPKGLLTTQPEVDRTRRLALMEGRDQYNRLLPMLGTIDPATDKDGMPIYFPDTEAYRTAGMAGKQLHGTLTWSSPTTEHVRLGDTEDWEIWNLTPDAHPIHLHLVSFELISRQVVNFEGTQQSFMDEAAEEGISIGPLSIVKDGTDLKPMPLLMHDGVSRGTGYIATSPNAGQVLTLFEKDNVMYGEYSQRLDTITVLPGQITKIRTTFDKPGRFVWHCHVLAHEDHQMMRVFHVGDMAEEDGGMGLDDGTTVAEDVSVAGDIEGDESNDSTNTELEVNTTSTGSDVDEEEDTSIYDAQGSDGAEETSSSSGDKDDPPNESSKADDGVPLWKYFVALMVLPFSMVGILWLFFWMVFGVSYRRARGLDPLYDMIPNKENGISVGSFTSTSSSEHSSFDEEDEDDIERRQLQDEPNEDDCMELEFSRIRID